MSARRESLRVAGVILFALLAQCGGSSGPQGEAGVDAGGEASVDAGADGGLDAGALDAGARDGGADARDARVMADATDAADVMDVTDAGSPGDSLPTNAVLFFHREPCPEGWEPLVEAAGRFPVPALIGGTGLETHGDPLASGEDRLHTHAVTATFDVSDVSYAGASGGGNRGVGQSGALNFATTSAPASTGLPYVQLLACRKTTATVLPAPVPAGMLIYYVGDACPAGYLQASVTEGRFVVGLPAGATNATPFGGAQIDATHPTHHAHANTPTLTTSPHGIGLASGCCASGYAGNGTYAVPTPTDDVDPGLPTVHLLQCQKL